MIQWQRGGVGLSDGAEDALDLLLGPEGLGNFRFVGDDDRGLALALMLLRHLRDRGARFDDGTPLHWIEAPTQGAGKTSLARLCTGGARSVAYTRSERERERAIATALVGSGVVFFDNVQMDVTSAVLARALTEGASTSRVVSGRRADWLVYVMTVQPGVNASEDYLGSRGRSVRIRLTGEPPEGRLPASLGADPVARETAQAELNEACSTLVEAWEAEGRPERSGPFLTRWRRWEAVLGGLLNLHEIPFLGGTSAVERGPVPAEDPLLDAVRAHLQRCSTGTSTALKLFKDPGVFSAGDGLRQPWTPRALSQLLADYEKRGQMAGIPGRTKLWKLPDDDET